MENADGILLSAVMIKIGYGCSRMTIRYIGNFPPPYGGVTRKNKLLYDCLSQRLKIRHFDKPSFLPDVLYQVLVLLSALVPGQQLIIGLSSRGGKSGLLTRLLFIFNRRVMRRSVYFMMGGTEAGRIASDQKERKWYGTYRKIYVETESMESCLSDAGLTNAALFPNCRRKPAENVGNHLNKKLQCVFFSAIGPAKGADVILDAAANLPDIDFSFYGMIDSSYERQFLDTVEKLENVRYMGIFKGDGENTYKELGKYDVLLFPTKWENEGVPGILVEAKMAGISCIVSDMNYNAELVHDGEDGIVMHDNDPETLCRAIRRLEEDRAFLSELKAGSWSSAEEYSIDSYINEIIETLCE